MSAETTHTRTDRCTAVHLDAVGKKRVTVVYPCEKVQRANRIAKSRGVKPSEIYRDALAEYLDKYETVASR